MPSGLSTPSGSATRSGSSIPRLRRCASCPRRPVKFRRSWTSRCIRIEDAVKSVASGGFPDGHGFEPKFLQFNGRGFRSGMRPCNDTDIYWFFSWTPTENDKATKLKRFVLANLAALKVPAKALAAIEASDDVFAVPLRFRPPLSLLAARISKGGVCVAGDALHPMTPDLGQGACAALEDSVVLARCLAKAVLGEGGTGTEQEQEHRRVEAGLREYAAARRWRSIQLIATAYFVGFLQQSNNAVVSFLRDRVLSGFLARTLVKMSDYDCGTL